MKKKKIRKKPKEKTKEILTFCKTSLIHMLNIGILCIIFGNDAMPLTSLQEIIAQREHLGGKNFTLGIRI